MGANQDAQEAEDEMRGALQDGFGPDREAQRGDEEDANAVRDGGGCTILSGA